MLRISLGARFLEEVIKSEADEFKLLRILASPCRAGELAGGVMMQDPEAAIGIARRLHFGPANS